MTPFDPECPYGDLIEGRRTFSRFVPDSCQGCIFPGDEAYMRCSHSGQPCPDEHGDQPWECCVQEPVGLCPDCFDEGIQATIYRNGRGIFSCANGHSFHALPEGLCPA